MRIKINQSNGIFAFAILLPFGLRSHSHLSICLHQLEDFRQNSSSLLLATMMSSSETPNKTLQDDQATDDERQHQNLLRYFVEWINFLPITLCYPQFRIMWDEWAQPSEKYICYTLKKCEKCSSLSSSSSGWMMDFSERDATVSIDGANPFPCRIWLTFPHHSVRSFLLTIIYPPPHLSFTLAFILKFSRCCCRCSPSVVIKLRLLSCSCVCSVVVY